MELTKEHIKEIREAFLKIETREHLLVLLNYTKPFVYGEKAVPFGLKQLTYYARLNTKYYTEFKVKKKSGGERTIHSPVKGLKAIQKTLAFVLQCVFEPHKAANGFVKEKSIVDNAKVHVGNHYVYNIDLKDFFQSIDQPRVWKCLQLKPFYLNNLKIDSNSEEKSISTGVRMLTTQHGENIFYLIKSNNVSFINDKKGNLVRFKKRMMDKVMELKQDNKISEIDDTILLHKILSALAKKYVKTDENIKQISNIQNYNRLDLASLIANLSCTEMEVERKKVDGNWEVLKRNVLPQGAPTSPVLTNVVCQRLDYLLTAVAKRFGLKYSRYADDITFSSLHNVFQDNSPFLNEMRRVIEDQGFSLNEMKTRLQVDGIRKEVTGLVVNEKVNVKKRYIKDLRKWLYLWEQYGYYKAEIIFRKDYLNDKGHSNNSRPNMIKVLDGKLNYLSMVKGQTNNTYFKLKERFDQLRFGYSNLEKILDDWEDNGIESAMELYNK